MLIVGRWIVFLVYVPLRAIYRRWGWSGILIGWTALVSLSCLEQYIGHGDTSSGDIQVFVCGIAFIAFLLWRRGRGDRVAHETFSPADEIAGQGVMAMDLSFCRYLGSVMHQAWGKNDLEIVAAMDEHSRRLHDADPNRAWNYREAMIKQSTADWPPEASQRLSLEMQEEWVPSPEDAQNWATLPIAVRNSYVRQGMLMKDAVASGFNAG